MLEANDSQTSFFDSWKILNGCFPELESFCSGLASVFPGMSQVESVYSIAMFEKDDFHSQLTDLSLEGILHANKEFKKGWCT